MRVQLDGDSVYLRLECHEEPGTFPCRVVCPDGCETFEQDHQHLLEPINYCNAAEFMACDGMYAESYIGGGEIPLHDGMAVEVEWTGDYYGWRAAEVTDPIDWKDQAEALALVHRVECTDTCSVLRSYDEAVAKEAES